MRYWPSFGALALFLLVAPTASAASLKTLYSFCAKTNCADGEDPEAPLIADSQGKLYGTTQSGGAFGHGVVFELIPSHDRTKWKYKRLHSFCGGKCLDGAEPVAGLIFDQADNLYGTTEDGGAGFVGTAFELSPVAGKWKLKVLHAFCKGGQTGCVDGQAPQHALAYAGASSGLPYDGTSPLYGITLEGGLYQNQFGGGEGTAYELQPIPGTGRWQEKVIYNFCSNADCPVRLPEPSSGLFIDASGNLIGTAADENPGGAVYELSPRGKKWVEKTLHTFCQETGCPDGSGPLPDVLIPDGSGRLLGTTFMGGANANSFSIPGGTLFSLNPTNLNFDTFYSFCTLPNCADGDNIRGSVTLDAMGTTLYGTASEGGTAIGFEGGGTVYKVTRDGFQVLYEFCSLSNCTDGSTPDAGVILDAWGNVYGTTSGAGPNNGGTVFEIVP